MNSALFDLENYVTCETTSKDNRSRIYPSPPGAYHDEDVLVSSEILYLNPQTPNSPSNTPVDVNVTTQFVSQKLEDSRPHSIIHDECIFDNLNSARTSCLDDLRYQLPDILTNFQSDSEGGDIPTPLTEKFYEASESGMGDYEAFNVLDTRKNTSKRSSQETEFSAEIGHNYAHLKISSIECESYSSPREQKPSPLPKSPRALSTSPSKCQDNHAMPSPCLQPTLIGPLLPPVATGVDFAFTFSKANSSNSNSSTGLVQRWPPEYSPPPPPTFQRSASTPTRNCSTSPIITNHRSFTGTYQISDGKLLMNEIYSHNSSSSTPRTSAYVSLEDSEAFASIKEDSVEQNEPEEEKSANEENRKRLYQRKMAVKELIDTEAVYLKDMNVVEEIYKGTAEACPNLEIGDIKTVFRNTEEIVSFSNSFLEDLKLAAFSIYTPRKRKTRTSVPSANASFTDIDRLSVAATLNDDTEEQRDRKTYIGAIFCKHLSSMQVIYTNFLKNSETASSRLLELQKDPAVKVWLSECNTVAKDLTAAWDLDALLVKPVQRITRYQLLLKQIQMSTPDTHPDFETLSTCCQELSNLLKNIDELKKRINMVAKIVGRKRKESDVVRTGIAKAFGRRIEKQSINPNHPIDDEEYLKIFQKFGDDYLRLQVVLRDAEYYSRQVSSHISDYLRYLSAIESIIGMSSTGYPEIESKWARFNASMREMGTNLIEEHMSDMKKLVVEPFEKTIAAYDGPLLAIKKRDKRKIDFDKATSLKSQGKKVDEKLQNLSNEYSALHETLKWELPKLSKLTEIMGNLILGNFISIQQKWYLLWMDKVQYVLEENQLPTDIPEIIAQFQRDSKYHEARLLDLGIIRGTLKNENNLQLSHSRIHSRRVSDVSNKAAPTIIDSTHSKRSSINLNGYRTPINSGVLPTSLAFPPSSGENNFRGLMNSPGDRCSRPNTGRSFNSETGLRASYDYSVSNQRESISARGSCYEASSQGLWPQSRLFSSAMPMEDNEDISESRDPSRDGTISRGYNILYLAASLFEFNISATKHEAGYIYLTYQAGEIFDVIGEKGELWLAKNQDDATNTVGWIWSKHFARLAAN